MTAGLADVLIVLVILGLFVAVAYVAIVLLARAIHGGQGTTQPRDPAVDALRTRFAVGDIDEAEFERLRSVLQRR